jgi:hypothetical protein
MEKSSSRQIKRVPAAGIAERYNISVIPLTLNWDGKTIGLALTLGLPSFTHASLNLRHSHTSQVTVQQYLDFFKPLLEAGHSGAPNRHLHGISASMNSASSRKRNWATRKS